MSSMNQEHRTAVRRAWLRHHSIYQPGHCTECAGDRTRLCAEGDALARAMRAEMVAGNNNGLPPESLPPWLTALLDGAE